jgi:hypothetical protein
MTRSKTGWLALGIGVVLALTGVTPAVYAHGGDPTLIHACVNNSSGEVKIVDANASCKHNETALDWPGNSAALGGGSIMVHGGSFGACPGCPTNLIIRTGGGAAEYRLPWDGTIQNTRIRIISNSYNGRAVVTLFVNGNPSVSTTIPAGSTTDIDVPGTVDVFDGDRVSVIIDQSAVSSGSMEIGVSYEIL